MTTGDLNIGEINEAIQALQIELATVEDWHCHSNATWQARDTAIRAEIHQLEHDRDMLPEP